MALGLFIVDTPVHVHMPPMVADVDELQLHYMDGGVLRGGWSLLDPADEDATHLVIVDAKDQATLDAIGELEGVELWQSL